MSDLDMCFESHRCVDELEVLGFGLHSQACHLASLHLSEYAHHI